jgi:hypothetical protein
MAQVLAIDAARVLTPAVARPLLPRWAAFQPWGGFSCRQEWGSVRIRAAVAGWSLRYPVGGGIRQAG